MWASWPSTPILEIGILICLTGSTWTKDEKWAWKSGERSAKGEGGAKPPPGGQGAPDQGILTGPVPSWVKEPPLKHFDKCKCAEKFNCNSPGFSYGQCDVGKQYCCYNSDKDGVLGSPLPSRPIHSPENGVLVGPGGPVDYPPGRPHPRPPHFGGGGGHGDVLVGPGGPTGIIGRPPLGSFGGGGGFGGPYRPGFGYGPRSAGKDDIKK